MRASSLTRCYQGGGTRWAGLPGPWSCALLSWNWAGQLSSGTTKCGQLMPTQAVTVSVWVCKKPLLFPDQAHKCSPVTRLMGVSEGAFI